MIRLSIARTVPVAVAVPMLALLAGCSGEAGGGSAGPTMRDSAGVTIVENPAGAVDAAPEWRLVTPPELDVGTIEGSEGEQLYRVRGAVRLPDGRIAVANAGTHELRFYGRDGELLRSVGREGEGPGEFRSMWSLEPWRGDSLIVDDSRLERLSFFDGSGRFGRSVALELGDEYGTPRLLDVMAGPSLLQRTSQVFRAGEATSGAHRGSLPLIRVDPTGGMLADLGTFPGIERYVLSEERRLAVTNLAFGRAPDVAAGGAGFYYGSADAWEVEERDQDGTLARLIRVDRAKRAVTPEIADRYRTSEVEDARESFRPTLRRMLSEMPVPDSMPAYDALEVDDAGNLWVRDYVPEWETGTRWTVFDADGAVRATLRAPRAFEVHQIGDDFVLGTFTDDLDVEHLRLYRLEKGGMPGGPAP